MDLAGEMLILANEAAATGGVKRTNEWAKACFAWG
jgi:hypothetical protein